MFIELSKIFDTVNHDELLKKKGKEKIEMHLIADNKLIG